MRPTGLGGLREVDGDEVGLADQVVEGDKLGAYLPGPVVGQVRVVGDQAHAESERPLGHQSSYPAEADDPEGLAVELDAFPAGTLPPARLQRRVGLGDVAGLGQEQSAWCARPPRGCWTEGR